MARYWESGGKRLDPDQIPFQVGTDEYYRYVAAWRAKQAGITYAPPANYDSKNWEHKTGANLNASEQQKDWWATYADETRGMDRGYFGTAPNENGNQYAQGADGRMYHDANGNGVGDPGEIAGKYGGAGQVAAGKTADNSWNDVWGADVRSAEQKYYDRNISNVAQVADAQGTYHWYGDETKGSAGGGQQKQRVDLTALGAAAGDQGFDTGAVYNYNGAIDKNSYDDQVRKRANVSIYGRTA